MQVCAHDSFVALDREDQGDVDADALTDHLGDGGNACQRRGDLDQDVRTIDDLVQLDRLRDGGVGVVSQARIDFDGHAAVDAVRRLELRSQDVARSTHVVGGHRGDGGVDIGAALCELTDLSVVRRSLGQCRLEDRRVGRDTHDRLRVDEVLQVAGLDAIPREVVEPDGNACSGELFGIHVLCHRDHPFTAARERCAASTVASAVMPNSRNKVL